jgi:hypothetical protein
MIESLNRIIEPKQNFTIISLIYEIINTDMLYFYQNDLVVLRDIVIRDITRLNEFKTRLVYLDCVYLFLKAEEPTSTSTTPHRGEVGSPKTTLRTRVGALMDELLESEIDSNTTRIVLKIKSII